MPTTTDKMVELAAKEFVLELQQHFVSWVLNDDELREYINPKDCSFTRLVRPPDMARHLCAQLIHLYYSYEVEKIEVSYPKDWWESFKERWFPKIMLKKWPVIYTHKAIKKEIALTDFPVDQYRNKIYLRDVSHMGFIPEGD